MSATAAPKLMNDAQIVSIQGALIGGRSSRSFPILVSAHYDSMSPAAVSRALNIGFYRLTSLVVRSNLIKS